MSLTIQDVFDISAEGMLKQSRRSFDKFRERCRYRNGDDRCGVGFLILDEHYDERLEGESVYTLAVREVLEKSGIYDGNCDLKKSKLLKKIQFIHDSVEVKDWKEFLSRVAKEFKLKTDVIEDYEWRQLKYQVVSSSVQTQVGALA